MPSRDVCLSLVLHIKRDFFGTPACSGILPGSTPASFPVATEGLTRAVSEQLEVTEQPLSLGGLGPQEALLPRIWGVGFILSRREGPSSLSCVLTMHS